MAEEGVKTWYDDHQHVGKGKGKPIVYCSCIPRSSAGYTMLFQNNEEEEENEQPATAKHRWWLQKVKKMKAMGGSDLKSFLRQHMKNKKAPRLQFHYDPKSYALNFDNDGDAHINTRLNFSAPFANPVLLTAN